MVLNDAAEFRADSDSDFDPDSDETCGQADSFQLVSDSPCATTSDSVVCDSHSDSAIEPQPSTSTDRRGRKRGRVSVDISDYHSESDEEWQPPWQSTSSNNNHTSQATASVRQRGRQRLARGRGGRINSHDVGLNNIGQLDPDVDNGWTERDSVPDIVPFTGNSGIQVEFLDTDTALDYFSTFIDNEYIDMFVKQTNLYAAQCIASKADAGPNFTYKKWKDVTTVEMKIFLALTMNMGLIWKADIK